MVDTRSHRESKSVYFYQHRPGPVAFSLTPDPPVVGTDTRETSGFLPAVAERLIRVMPKLAALKVRRTWRGLYPMTPDASPIVGWARELTGFLHAVGMCGQGYMLGPGVGSLLTRMVLQNPQPEDEATLQQLSPYRDFHADEKLR